MAISRIGSATGVNSCTLPTHQADDYIFIVAFTDGSVTPPSLPAGYTSITTGGANSSSIRAGYKKATSSSETSGTWTGATSVIAVVYRGVDLSSPVGGSLASTGNTATMTYGGITMASTTGGNWVIGAAGTRAITATIENPPSGMTNVTSVLDATDEMAWHDTNGGYEGTWPSTNVGVGVAAGWHSVVFELKKADVTSATGNQITTDSQEFHGSRWTRTNVDVNQNYPTGYTDSTGGSTAYQVLETATTTVHDIRRTTDVAVSASTDYRAWAEVAPSGRNFVTLRLFDSAFTSEASFTIDLTSGALQNNSYGTGLTNVSGSSTALSNGFYRIDIKFNSSTSTAIPFRVLSNINITNDSAAYLGDVTKGFYIDSVGIVPVTTVTQSSTFTNSQSFPAGTVSNVGSGTQTLTQTSTFTDTDTTPGGRLNLVLTQASTFTDADTLPAGQVNLRLTQASTFTDTDTFPAGQVNLRINHATTFTDGDTFFSGSVVFPSQTVTQSATFTDGDTFPAGQVNLRINQASVFTDSDTFPAGQLNLTLTQATTFTNTASFYTGVISQGTTVNQSTTFTNTNTFFAGQLNLKLTQASTFTDTDTFPAGNVIQKIAGSLLTDGDTFFAGQLNLRVNSNLFTDADTFYTGQVNLRISQSSTFTNSQTFPAGTVTFTQTITAGAFTNTNTFYSGALSSPQTIYGTLFTNGSNNLSGSRYRQTGWRWGF